MKSRILPVFVLAWILVLGISTSSSADWYKPYFNLSNKVLDPGSMPFVAHAGEGHFDNWIALNVPLAPVQALKTEIEKAYRLTLRTTGEAHITLISPLEYHVLKQVFTMEELNALVAEHLQKARFSITCLGSGEAMLAERMERTFFVVVQAPDLIAWRERIHSEFVKRGTRIEKFDPGAFKPLEYFPHITVGYTKEDIHIHQGLVKDARSCSANVKLQ